MKSQEEQVLYAQVERVRTRLQGLATDLRSVDDEVESLAPVRMHHELLEQACGSLEKLSELGAASLFWGERIESSRVAEQLRSARGRVSAFQTQLGELDERRRAILAKIGREEGNLGILGEDLFDLREAEERRKLEWVIERDISPVPHRIPLMAWASGGEDDRRFYKALAASLLFSLLFGALLPMIDLPLPKRFEPEDMPKRLVQFVRQEQAKPLPPPPVVAKAPTEQQKPKPVQEPKPSDQRDQPPPETPAVAAAKPQPQNGEPWPPGQPDLPPGQPDQLPAGTQGVAAAEPQPQMRAGKPGILAFKDQFASLTKDKVAPRLGAGARFVDTDDGVPVSTRAMLTTNAPGSSGGINLASLSRNVRGGGGGGPGAVNGDGGGGGGGGIEGVAIGRVTSGIAPFGSGGVPGGGGGGGGGRLGGGGLAPSRTDEEIQIVFDRYKASFYRLYNRELRNDPTLSGQMVLRLTIEPDGSVSMCVLQSTDMNAPDLAAQVVNRVRTINFGAKDDVQALTIVYPIDFLPSEAS